MIFRMTVAAGILAAAAAASAATYAETWEGFSGGGGATPITGSPNLAGWTLDYDATTPRSSITTNTFPGIGSTKALDTNGSVFDWIQLNSSSSTNTIPITGGILQFALPINVVSLDPADAEIDLLTLETDRTSTYSPLWAIRAAANAPTSFRTTTDFGWPGTGAPISDTIFQPGNPGSWAGTGWRVLAFRIQFGLSGTGNYRVIEATTTGSNVIQSYTGATNTSIPTEVQAITAALCISASPRSTASTRVLIDDIVFWDDSFASDAAFVTAVRSRFNLIPASVSDWSLYE